MNRSEFINFLLEKGKIDSKVIELSKSIENFPQAYRISLAIDGSDFINSLLNPKSYGEIDLASGDLKSHNLVKDSEVKQQAIKFINDLTKKSKLKFGYKKHSSSNSSKQKLSSDTVLGIDLGTTNSLSSIVENGQAITIPMKNGARILPSVISINKMCYIYDRNKNKLSHCFFVYFFALICVLFCFVL